MSEVKLYLGDCLDILPTLAAQSVDAVVTDPPYGAGIAEWDMFAPSQEILDECLRVSRGSVIWFGGRSVSELCAFGQYDPKPDRMLIWHVTFSLGRTGDNGMFYRWHPIWCWRLPDKQQIIGNDVLKANTEGHHDWGNHPAAKPIKLMSDLVNAFGGITILDPFMGSGTTGVACVQTGRNFIGIEINPTYYAIAERRIHDAQLQMPLFEVER